MMAEDMAQKKLRGSGGYAIARINDEEQKKGNLGGPELFLAGIGVYVVWAALAAWLFLSVRKLAERDWRFTFSPEGVNPWSAEASGRN